MDDPRRSISRSARRLRVAAVAGMAMVVLGGCGFSVGTAPAPGARATSQEAFWAQLARLCGHAYAGRMVEGADTVFVRNRLVLDGASCTADEVRLGFVIGPDSSRTWVVRRVPAGLALRHEVRDVNGSEDPISGYGGTTVGPGTPERQDFRADTFTARLLPPAAGNVWSLEIAPGRTFDYTVWKPGVRQRFRLEFDLSRPLAGNAR